VLAGRVPLRPALEINILKLCLPVGGRRPGGPTECDTETGDPLLCALFYAGARPPFKATLHHPETRRRSELARQRRRTPVQRSEIRTARRCATRKSPPKLRYYRRLYDPSLPLNHQLAFLTSCSSECSSGGYFPVPSSIPSKSFAVELIGLILAFRRFRISASIACKQLDPH